MPKRRSLIIGLSLVAMFGVAQPAGATIDNQKSFKQAYPGKTVTCKACHNSAIGKPGDLNTYGQALQKLKAPVDTKKLKPEDYKAVEAGDADGDGAPNGKELEAGTDPADPQSKPAKPGAAVKDVLMPSAWAAKAEPDKAKAAPAESAKPVAEYVGTETCAACHAKQHQEFLESTHSRISIPGEVKAQGCEMCHGPGSLHAEAGGGRGVGGIINPRKDPSTCFACHLDKKAEFRLPYHHPLIEGKMSCTDCHNAHAPDVRPWSATSLQDINEACFRCHKEQRGPFVWEHEALREGCTTCHKVHGSIHEKMLLVRDNNLCLRCHTQTNFPTIGGSGHGGRLPSGTCFSAGCHVTVHGSNFDEHLRY